MGQKIKPYSINPKAGTSPEFTFTFQEGFVLIIDTREQAPLFINKPPRGLMLSRDYLPIGDYSIKGFEGQISIERKASLDLFNCLGKDRERFKKELILLSGYLRKYVVVEATEEEILAFSTYSKMHPNSVRQSIASIEIRYGIGFHYEPDRKRLERWVLDRFIKFYKLKRAGEL